MSEEATLDEFVQEKSSEENPEGQDGWSRQPLSEISLWTDAGGTPRTSNDDYWDGDIPWVQTGELTKRHIRSTEKQITEIGLKESTAKRFPPGTLLIGMYGEPTVGESALLEIEATTNQACCGVCPDTDIVNAEFLHQMMQYEKPRLYSLRAGSGQQNIRQGIIRKFEIEVPTLPEQRKIATVLYTVDRAIEKTEEVIEQAKTIKFGVIQDLFREGVQEHDSFTETKSGKVPSGWEIARLEELIEDTRYGTDTKSNTNGDGYPTLRIPNIVDKRITVDDLKYTPLDDKELDRLKLQESDILVIRTNGNPDYVGRCATFSEREEPFVFASYLIRIRVDESTVRPEYVREFLNSPRGRSEMAGWIRSSAGNYNLSVGAMEKFQVPIPSLEEQDEIVEKIEAVKRTIEVNRHYRGRLDRLKRGLMQDLLSGTVRTNGTNIEVPEEITQHG